jgi:DNA-binding transcriptional ArsR family regulator
MSLAQSITRAKGGDWTGKQGLVPGPGHHRKDRSMAIMDNETGDDVICHSFAFDDPLAYKAALRAEGLLPSLSSRSASRAAPLQSYVYRDSDSAPLYRIVRKPGKKFVAETPDGRGGWRAGMGGTKAIPYRLPELLTADQCVSVYIVEGEKDADTLASLNFVATTNPFGAGKWPIDFAAYFTDREVFIIPDNDAPGQSHADDVARKMTGVARSIAVIRLPGLAERGDVSDWIAAGGTAEKLFQLAMEATPCVEPTSADVMAPRAFGSLTASALDRLKFAPLRYVIPGILPEGLAILAGKPKFGKSFAALDLGIAVSSGAKAFGSIPCEAGDVLYCALEDSRRRLQDRLRGMLPRGAGMPELLHLETAAKRIDEGLMDDLRGWLADHPGARLVILDTWRCIKPASQSRSSAYEEDASGLHPVHELAKDHPGVAIVVIHHTRKLEADDPFDTISGTHGLTGVADTLLVLAKHGEGAKLCGQGRDIDGYEKALTRNTLTGSWKIVGDAREMAKTGERQAVLDVLAEAEEPIAPTKIATAIGKTRTNVQHLLKRLDEEGLAKKVGHGKWTLAGARSLHSLRSLSDALEED